MKALSIRQPWAWLIVNGYKDVENRTWPTKHRGPILVHAGSQMDPEYTRKDINQRGMLEFMMDCQRQELWTMNLFRRQGAPWPDMPAAFDTGGIVGIVTIADCETIGTSRWFSGPYGFALKDAAPLPFIPCPGKLGFFDVAADVERQALAALAAVVHPVEGTVPANPE